MISFASLEDDMSDAGFLVPDFRRDGGRSKTEKKERIFFPAMKKARL